MKRPEEHERAMLEAGFDPYKLAPAAGALVADYAELLVELETLRASVDLAAKYVGTGCGDSVCLFERQSGMMTNGGCRCTERRPGVRHALAKLYKAAKMAVGKVPP